LLQKCNHGNLGIRGALCGNLWFRSIFGKLQPLH